MQFPILSFNFPLDSASCISGQQLGAHPLSLISLALLLGPLEQHLLLCCTMYTFGTQCKTPSKIFSLSVFPPHCLSMPLAAWTGSKFI